MLQGAPREERKATVLALWLISVADTRPDDEAVSNMVRHNLVALGSVAVEPLLEVVVNGFGSYEDWHGTYGYRADYNEKTGRMAAEALINKMTYNRIPDLRTASMQGLTNIILNGKLGDLDPFLSGLMRERAVANANIRHFSDVETEEQIRGAANDLLQAIDRYTAGHLSF